MQIFLKAVPESMFQLIDVCWKSKGRFLNAAHVFLIRFRKPLHKPTGEFQLAGHREYEFITEAHTQLSVVRNCFRFSLPVCSGGGETAGGLGVISNSRRWGGETDSTVHTGIEHLEQFRTTES